MAKFLAVRLHPGELLKERLCDLVIQHGLQAAFISAAVGSLRRVCLRLADGKECVTLQGPFEIVSLSGTLCFDGVHVHVSVSDREGHVRGGHLLDGSEVFTTCELIVGVLPDVVFERHPDSTTSYDELMIRHPLTHT